MRIQDSIALSWACGGACTAIKRVGFIQLFSRIWNTIASFTSITSSIYRNTLQTLRFFFLSLIFALFTGGIGYAQTPDNTETTPPVEEIKTLNKTLVADLAPEFRVILEGEELQSSAVSKSDKGGVYVRAEPIFEALNDEYEFNIDEGVLVVHRSQDGVVMELYTDSGVVKANGKALGKLKHFGEVRQGMINLTPNAIAVLSGAVGKIDENRNVIDFKLDPRLKVATGFEIFVNEVPLGELEPAPKSIGSVMLLPLRPIADELGHDIQLLDGGTSIKVIRSQDSAAFELNLDTGLVKLNDRPVGVAKDITYIDSFNLLLPISVIETLTGTHIDVAAGTSRINVVLDDRLSGAIQPGEKVEDISSIEPFTVETLSFHTGLDTINTVDLDFRIKGSNGKIRYEIPDLPTNAAEAEPSWLSMDIAHKSGARGTVGDYSADFRELEGVRTHRIRGVSVVKANKDSRWALAAGVPVSGNRRISDDQYRQEFGGFAAGVRYADKKGWEAGVSYKADGLSDDQMAVLSAISGKLGRKRDKDLNWNAEADIGVFSGSARVKSVDVQGSLNARYEVNKNININAFTKYTGGEFLRSDLDGEDRLESLNTDQADENTDAVTQFVPDTRVRGKDQLRLGTSLQVAARKDIGIFNRPAASIRYGHNQSGVFTETDDETTTDNFGATINTAIRPIDTSISLDWSAFSQKENGEVSQNGNQVSARIYKNTKYVSARAQYSSTKRNGLERKNRLQAQITATPYRVQLPKSSRLSISPSIAGSWSGDGNQINGGVVANFDSGLMLGRETKLDASFGVLQNFSSNNGSKSDKYLTVGIGRRLPINKNLQLGLSYRNDLNGNQRVGLFLDGRFDFNEKRKFRNTQDGRGVLKGRAYFDKNRDGVKQEDEPGVGGVLISIKGTRMALRTDRDGYYTIQNIKEGLYEIQLDNRSLPLGFSLSEDVSTRATIREGHLTDVPMPIVQRGQVRGFAFIDADKDGLYSKGEERLEGAQMLLTNLDDPKIKHKIYATSFGQYAFGDLPTGRYEIQIVKTNRPGSVPSKPVIVDLGKDDDLMVKVNVAAITETIVKSVEQNLATGPPGSVDEGPNLEIPPPDNPAP